LSISGESASLLGIPRRKREFGINPPREQVLACLASAAAGGFCRLGRVERIEAGRFCISPRYAPQCIFEVFCKKGHHQGMPQGV
jgi:hypothetical protein